MIDVISKLFILLSIIFIIACSKSEDDVSNNSEQHAIKSSNEVISLINRNSNDTTALQNLLVMAESTNDHYTQMIINDKLGNYYISIFNFYRAIEFHKYYLTLAENIKDSIHTVKALNRIAFDYNQFHGYNQSSEYLFKALTLISKLNNRDKNVQIEKAYTLRGLGYIYLVVNQTEEAINLLQESLELEEQNENLSGEAKTLLHIGSFFEQNNNYDSAYYYYNQSLEKNIKINSVSGICENYVYIGNLFIKNKDYEGALIYLESAYNIIYGTSDKINHLRSCLSLGSLFVKLDRFRDAEKYINEGLRLSTQLEMPGYLEKAHLLLSDLYNKEGKTPLALEERILSEKYALEFRGGRNLDRLLHLRLDYENSINEEKRLFLTEQLKIKDQSTRKGIITSYAIILILISLIYSIVKYFTSQKRKKETEYQYEVVKSELYQNISKELATPISIILNMAERLKENMDNQKYRNNNFDFDVFSQQTDELKQFILGITSLIKLHDQEEQGGSIQDLLSDIKKDNVDTIQIQNEGKLFSVVKKLKSINSEMKDMFNSSISINGDSEKYDESSTEFIKQVTDIIYREITNTENLIETISSEVCLSTSQLNRKIKAITGMTTSNYILKVRLTKAKKQLSTTQKLIGEIAMECGFNDFAYFSRSFKKEFEMTPTTFQRLPYSAN